MTWSRVLLTIGLFVLYSRSAFADYPLNFLAGPQVAWSWGRTKGVLWGWEAGVGYGAQRLNLGQAYGREQTLSYGVAEPYTLYVGGTLGVAFERTSGVLPVFGVWEGVPVIYPEICEPERRADFGFLLTVAVGYRYVGGHQVYVAPKAGVSHSAIGCDSGSGTSGG